MTGEYVVRVTDDLFVDAEDPDVSSWCRYINHDPRPNLALKVLPKGIGGKPRIWFVALRPISVHDELCFDYGPDFWVEELDGVATAHNERVDTPLPPSPWYKQPSSSSDYELHAAGSAMGPTEDFESFTKMENALLESLHDWEKSS